MVVADINTEVEDWLSQAAAAKDWRDRAALRSSTTPEILLGLKDLNHPDIDTLVDRLFNHPFDTFEPRDDNQDAYDEQTGYYESKADITVACGGNGCLGAEQTIFDPVAKKFRRVGSIRKPFHVFAISPSGDVCVAKASRPWVKGIDDLYRISLSNGESFICTLDHRVLSRGRWQEVRGLRVGDPLSASCVPTSSICSQAISTFEEQKRRTGREDFQLPLQINPACANALSFQLATSSLGCLSCEHPLLSSLELDRKSCLQGVPRLSRTQRDFRERCLLDHHRHDAQLLLASSIDRAFALRSVDVPERTPLWLRTDVPAISRECSHTCRQSFPHARSRFAPLVHHGHASRIPRVWQPCSQPFGQVGIHGQDASSSTVAIHPTIAGLRSLEANDSLLHTTSAFQQVATETEFEKPSRYLAGGNGDEKPTHITAIEFVRRDVFYDLEVSPHHNYLAAGVWHHNSGKTFVGAQRCNRLLTTELEPPAKDTPFWIIANTYEMACGSCWKQNLRNIIPTEWIDEPRISWYKEKRDWPLAVPLKPWPGTEGRNWVLEFKSYEQGRELMQSTSIGGAWFTEQFPWEVFEEVLRGCRKWMRPGCIWMEFTPIDPAKSVEIQDVYEAWTAGDEKYRNWAFYHLSTEEAVNAGHAEQSWYDAFFSTVSEEMAETRKRGVFASYEGAIYKSFKPKIHLIDDDEWPPTPPNVWHRRSIDWGASEEHPFCCEWGYRDAIGCWWIYDEYWNNSQSITSIDHIEEINNRHPWPENSPYHGATYGDPSRPDQMMLFGRFGIPITPAKNAVYDGIESVRRCLKNNESIGEPMLFINRHRCPKLARQMSTYRWLRSTGKGVNPKVARPEPLKKDDDAADALRYLIHSEYIAQKGAPRGMHVDRPKRPGINHKRNGKVWNGQS